MLPLLGIRNWRQELSTGTETHMLYAPAARISTRCVHQHTHIALPQDKTKDWHSRAKQQSHRSSPFLAQNSLSSSPPCTPLACFQESTKEQRPTVLRGPEYSSEHSDSVQAAKTAPQDTHSVPQRLATITDRLIISGAKGANMRRAMALKGGVGLYTGISGYYSTNAASSISYCNSIINALAGSMTLMFLAAKVPVISSASNVAPSAVVL